MLRASFGQSPRPTLRSPRGRECPCLGQETPGPVWEAAWEAAWEELARLVLLHLPRAGERDVRTAARLPNGLHVLGLKLAPHLEAVVAQEAALPADAVLFEARFEPAGRRIVGIVRKRGRVLLQGQHGLHELLLLVTPLIWVATRSRRSRSAAGSSTPAATASWARRRLSSASARCPRTSAAPAKKTRTSTVTAGS